MKRLSLVLAAVSCVFGLALGAAAANSSTTVSATVAVANFQAGPDFVSLAGDGPGGCAYNATLSAASGHFVETCPIRLRESANSNVALTWFVGFVGNSLDFVSPASGTLHPGQSVTVKFNQFDCGNDAVVFFAHSTAYLNGVDADPVAYACG